MLCLADDHGSAEARLVLPRWGALLYWLAGFTHASSNLFVLDTVAAGEQRAPWATSCAGDAGASTRPCRGAPLHAHGASHVCGCGVCCTGAYARVRELDEGAVH